jgi:hypothetical protein
MKGVILMTNDGSRVGITVLGPDGKWRDERWEGTITPERTELAGPMLMFPPEVNDEFKRFDPKQFLDGLWDFLASVATYCHLLPLVLRSMSVPLPVQLPFEMNDLMKTDQSDVKGSGKRPGLPLFSTAVVGIVTVVGLGCGESQLGTRKPKADLSQFDHVGAFEDGLAPVRKGVV